MLEFFRYLELTEMPVNIVYLINTRALTEQQLGNIDITMNGT